MILINTILSMTLALFVVCAAASPCAAGAAPMTVAHRGAPDFAPENTIDSFLIAQSQGADAIECDLRLTSDGKLAVVHDPTTGRVWSADLSVEQSTMRELSSLRLSAGFRAAFPSCAGGHIPEFAELVRVLGQDTHIFAELKTEGRAACDALLQELHRLNAADRTTVISFSRDTVKYFAAQGVACAWLCSCDRPAQVLELDIPPGAAIDVNFDALDANTVAALHERGQRVFCYTVAGQSGYHAMRNIGVDAVTANNLAFLSDQ